MSSLHGAAGVQCFDTVYTDLENEEGFREDVNTIHLRALMGNRLSIQDRFVLYMKFLRQKEKEINFCGKSSP